MTFDKDIIEIKRVTYFHGTHSVVLHKMTMTVWSDMKACLCLTAPADDDGTGPFHAFGMHACLGCRGEMTFSGEFISMTVISPLVMLSSLRSLAAIS